MIRQATLGLRRIEPAQGAPGLCERLFGRHGVPRDASVASSASATAS
jgi:hypothetical protein